jgi:hypothetical protein
MGPVTADQSDVGRCSTSMRCPGQPLIAIGGVEKGERGRRGQSVDVRRMTF